ncbi:hypothetical protein LMG29542_07475 [Paraburkholderia humisilvae]|uniref:Uncharacterized protein n=1 Tax=Paraburkholderia humisilvae TaxID=627669 RepID=A0A6J5F4Y8_9BURK|nr:hypothetical protein LMG29542_07475 [Paraburkholderia humisilvae]
MDAPRTALREQDTTITGSLYVAFELGGRSRKLLLGNGVRAPSRCAVAALSGSLAPLDMTVLIIVELE